MTNMQKQSKSKSTGMGFKDFRLLNLVFSMNKDFTPKTKAAPIVDIEIAYEYADKNLVWVSLRVIQHGKAPYLFDVRSAGLFEFQEMPPKEVVDSFARINCAAIMFPYLRETIADLTRRAGFPPQHLQPVNFVNLYAKAKAEEAGKKKKPAKKKKVVKAKKVTKVKKVK